MQELFKDAKRLYYEQKGDEAIQKLDQALKYDEKNDEVKCLVVDILAWQGKALASQKLHLEISANTFWKHYAGGCVALAKGDLAESEREYKSALSLAPDSSETYCYLGFLAKKKGDIDGAIELYRKSAELDKTNPVPLANLARILSERGKYDDAVSFCNDALKRQKSCFGAYLCRGEVFIKLGNKAGALSDFRAAEELNPKNNKVQQWLAYLRN